MSFLGLGGGGGGSSSSVTQQFLPPEITKPGWQQYVNRATDLSNTPLQQYGGQMVANQSPMTTQGLQMLSDYAMQGTPERTAGGQALMGAMQGTVNPYSTTANPYMGQNPYLSQMIDTSNQKIANQYQRGTAAQTDAQAARSGAYGGSAYADMVKQNEQGLAGALGANTNALLGQNYQQSAALADAGLNRAAQGWQSGMTNALTGAQLGQSQQGIDAAAIQQFLAGGQIPQGYQQQLLNAAQQYFGQGQNMPYQQLEQFGGALGRASGSYGSTSQPGASPITGLLGLGALGLGAWPNS